MKHTCWKLDRTYIKTGLPADGLAYVSKVKEQSTFFCLKEHLYWLNHISSNAASMKKLWNDLEILLLKSTMTIVKMHNLRKISENFSRKKSTIIGWRQAMHHQISTQCTPTLSTFQPITIKQVELYIATMPNKHCTLDPVPTSVVKRCSTLLAPYFTNVFNTSLAESYVPVSQIAAFVKTFHTKKGAWIKKTLKIIDQCQTSCFCQSSFDWVLGWQRNSIDTECLSKISLYGECPVKSVFRHSHGDG